MSDEGRRTDHSAAGNDPLLEGRHDRRFILDRTLGEGGMAVVALAHDSELNREVAVKRMHPELAGSPEACQRFVDEAQIMAALDHPGALPVFCLGRLADGELFYAMKKVTGTTLANLLDARSRADITSRHDMLHYVDIFERVCQTVAAAHRHGIIHRDIKPENVMVDEYESVYLVDWGLARRLSPPGGQDEQRRTRYGAVMGTPAYMSPEQASGQSAESDRQSDVFSLGVVLYEILTGSSPFADDDPRTSMKGVIYHDPVSPKKLNPRTSRALAAVCTKALNKDPFRRYPSAVELAADIRRYREFLPVTAIPPRLIDRVFNWSRRQPVIAAVLATLAVVGVASLVGLTMTASVERHMVEDAYEEMDLELAELAGLEAQLEEITLQIGQTRGNERSRLVVVAADLEAQIEAVRELLITRAAAIVGFTLFSPERRARTVAQQLILDRVEEWIEEGEYGRAKVALQAAILSVEGRNLFGLDDAQRKSFERLLETVNAELEAHRLAADLAPEPAG